MPIRRRPPLALVASALFAVHCSPDEPGDTTFTSLTPSTSAPTTQSSFTGDPEVTSQPTTSSGTTEPDETTVGVTPGTTGPGTTEVATTDASTTDASTTDASTTDATTTDATGSTSTGTTDASTSTGGDPVCGDGVVEGDELCDDGNDQDGDACLSDCTPGQGLLALVGAGDAPALFARYVPGPGWSIGQASTSAAEAALAPHPEGGAIAAVRRAGPFPQDQNELVFATWSPDQPDELAGFAEVGAFGFGVDGPALAAAGVGATLAFLGTDNKHYTALLSDGAWSPFSPLPAGMVQLQAFGPSAAALAGGAAETYAVYAGDDSKVYYTSKASPGGAWQASSQAPPPAVINTLTPAALVDGEGDLVIAYVRKADGKLAVVKLTTPQNAWTTETIVHPQAITGSEISLVRTDAGAYYLAWKSFDGQGIYVVRGAAHDSWGTPVAVEVPMASTHPPALVRGAPGAEAELLYTAGGKLRHARLVGESVDALADVPGADGLTTRPAALRVQLQP